MYNNYYIKDIESTIYNFLSIFQTDISFLYHMFSIWVLTERFFRLFSGIEYVIGVAGSKVELPCHMNSPQQKDKVTVALWFKEGNRHPLYR